MIFIAIGTSSQNKISFLPSQALFVEKALMSDEGVSPEDIAKIFLIQSALAGLATTSILFLFPFCQKSMPPLIGEIHFSSVPPSNSLVSVSDP